MKEKIKHEPAGHDEHEILFNNEWINVWKVQGFCFAERLGIDSIAFLLFANNLDDPKRIGVLRELKIPVNKYVVGAFGGSIDDIKYHEDINKVVIDEAIEEAGFIITEEDIEYYGKHYVSTQMNQFCHLFGVNVDKKKQVLRTTQNIRELDSTIQWIDSNELLLLEDWKALVIFMKRRINSSISIDVRNIPANQISQAPAVPEKNISEENEI